MMGARLGINAAFSTTLDNGGASQILAVILAVMAIDAGLATTVVCGFGRDSAGRAPARRSKRNCRTSGAGQPAPREHGLEFGLRRGRRARLGARRHMIEYGTTREEFAAVAVAFREHALRNPDAR